eukprot:CAMPEP_0177656870 /NCGR_PEP_ID=MMETSP0447-20121125/15837_1 /TAXON_ID=0 /ORGANISM="Stygamoeba regulata, Strain BSH-02190019" /LENGTH=196 /DNA_ID=CAMNT_0019161097 /DNA_START=301 /DNA_END=888 /DNA_ORIENTATION=+
MFCCIRPQTADLRASVSEDLLPPAKGSLPEPPPMEVLLDDPKYLESFKKYTEEILSLEYLECYLDLRKLTSDWENHTEKEKLEIIYDIYQAYVVPDAEKRVTLQAWSWSAVTYLFEEPKDIVGPGSFIPMATLQKSMGPGEASRHWIPHSPTDSLPPRPKEGNAGKNAAVEQALSKGPLVQSDFAMLANTLKHMLW